MLRLSLPEGTPMFRVEVQEKLPDVQDWLGDPKRLQVGPTTGSAYHTEFLDMVTPPEARAVFTNSELLQVAATGAAGQLALKAIAGAIREALKNGRTREACHTVRGTLADLNVERARAGLPPVDVPECR